MSKILTLLVLLPVVALAQATLTVGSTTGPSRAMTLAITLSGAEIQPSGLEFALKYPTNLTLGQDLTIKAGALLREHGKSLSCFSPAAGLTKCFIGGINDTPLPNGEVGRLEITLPEEMEEATIAIEDTLGATPDGGEVSIRGVGGQVKIMQALFGNGFTVPIFF
jgi:hypothetical protein